MAKFTYLLKLMQSTMASALAVSVSVATPSEVAAQSSGSESAQAFDQACSAGTVRALERFIERYPLSPEANVAFREIIVLSQNSKLVNGGPTGLATSSCDTSAAPTRSISPY